MLPFNLLVQVVKTTAVTISVVFADLLSTLMGRVQLTPSESSNLEVGSSVASASCPSVYTRMTMSGFGAVSKSSGNENYKSSILNFTDQYEACHYNHVVL